MDIHINDDDDDDADAVVKVAGLMGNGQMVSGESGKPQLCFHQQFNHHCVPKCTK